MGRLDVDDFMDVVRGAPLVSIDLLLRDRDGRVLLGLRRNAPAQGTWFVPGGRIRKDERLADAFSRICKSESGVRAGFDEARFLGVFEHFYEGENAGGIPDVSTHYISLAFELHGIPEDTALSADQHSEWEWRDVALVLSDARVHLYTKEMLRGRTGYPAPADRAAVAAQYQLVADRRNTTNSLLWQTPVLSLTAQAFLFTIALSPSVGSVQRAIAAGLAFVVALASVQLLVKHRAFERDDAEWLYQFETRNHWRGLEHVSRRRELVGWPQRWAASKIWVGVLLLFGAAAVYVLVDALP